MNLPSPSPAPALQASASPAGLSLDRVSATLGGSTVVDDLSLRVEQGEFFTLLGPSGSGKSTTLNLIAGFLEPDAGTIEIAGRPTAGMPPERRDIGIVFQSYALFPHLTVAENVAFPLRRRRVAAAERRRRVTEALEMVELSDRAGARPAELSGGQQQRAALARALVFEPRLVLLDEPLGALDRRLRLRLQEHIRELHRRIGFTAVYVTHDQEEALTLSDRIAIMNGGRLEQVGDGTELYRTPSTLFAARFLGDANVFPGVVETTDGATGTIRLDGGASVRAPLGGTIAAGDRATLVARPEELSAVAGPVGDRVVLAQGTVAERTFLGHDDLVTVRDPTGVALKLRERPGATPDATPPSTGSPVAVTWSPLGAGVIVPASDRPSPATDQEPL